MGRGAGARRNHLPIASSHDHGTPPPTRRERVSVLGWTCEYCGRGVYAERFTEDDLFGRLHCSACGRTVDWERDIDG